MAFQTFPTVLINRLPSCWLTRIHSCPCPDFQKSHFPFKFNILLISTDVPMVPQDSLQHFISSQENCPSISVLIQITEIEDIATLTYKLNVSSDDGGCALQECPMMLSPRERILTITLMDNVSYTATLEVSNDCGSNSTRVIIQPGM